jgi:hypothetical protein
VVVLSIETKPDYEVFAATASFLPLAGQHVNYQSASLQPTCVAPRARPAHVEPIPNQRPTTGNSTADLKRPISDPFND